MPAFSVPQWLSVIVNPATQSAAPAHSRPVEARLGRFNGRSGQPRPQPESGDFAPELKAVTACMETSTLRPRTRATRVFSKNKTRFSSFGHYIAGH